MKRNCSGCEDFVAIDIDWFCQVLQINILHWVGWFQPHAMKGSSICCPGGGSCRLNVIISPFPSVCSMLAMVEKPAVQLDSDCLSEFWRNKFQSKCFFLRTGLNIAKFVFIQRSSHPFLSNVSALFGGGFCTSLLSDSGSFVILRLDLMEHFIRINRI